MYDPVLGRFLQRDPVRPPVGGDNLYAYVGDRPASGTDPLGQIKWNTLKFKGNTAEYSFFTVETNKGTVVELFFIPPGKKLCHTFTFSASERDYEKQKLNFSFTGEAVATILKDEYEEVTDPEKLTKLAKAGKCVVIFYNGPDEKKDISHSAKLVTPAFGADKKVDPSKTTVNSQTPFGKLREGVTVDTVLEEIKEIAEKAKKEGRDTSAFKVTAVKYWCEKP